MAVNLTKNMLEIFDKPVKGQSRTGVILPSQKNSYVNLHNDIKAKLYMRKLVSQGSREPLFDVTDPFNFQEVGIQNTIKMRESFTAPKGMSRDVVKQMKDNLKKIELATMISPAQQPYEKTKILRIVQRTVLINELKHDILCREPYGNTNATTKLEAHRSLDYDFFALNTQNALTIKLEPKIADEESKIGQPQLNHSLSMTGSQKQLS